MGYMTGYYPEPKEEPENPPMFLIVEDADPEYGCEEERTYGGIEIFNGWAEWDQIRALRMQHGQEWKYNAYTTIYRMDFES